MARRLRAIAHRVLGSQAEADDAVPFDEIAGLLDRTPEATRQLASRARRRVRGGTPSADTDRGRRREVVDAFLTAAREGDFAPGCVTFRDGRPFSVMAFEVAGDKIVAIDILVDRERLAGLDLAAVA
jgi:hypothetical protein